MERVKRIFKENKQYFFRANLIIYSTMLDVVTLYLSENTLITRHGEIDSILKKTVIN